MKLLVLKVIIGKSMTGYDVIKSIENIIGKKPSSGTIYPILSNLFDDGYLTFKDEGNKKIYTITKKGKKFVEEILTEREKIIFSRIKLMSSIDEKCCPDEFSKKLIDIDRNLLEKNVSDWMDLKKIGMELMLSSDYELKRKNIQLVLKETVKKLIEIKNQS